MTRAATVLTLLCAGTVALYALSWALLPKEGMEQLALILPWMLMLGAHLILGPIALFLCIRDRKRVGHAGIYLYFLAFTAVQAFELVRVSDLDEWAVDRYHQVVHGDEYALSEALFQAWRQKQLERPPDEEALRKLEAMARELPRIEHTFERHRKSSLTHAAGLGRPELVTLMLERGADENGTAKQDDAPLLAAAEAADPEMVKLLLEGGADASRAGYAGENAVLLLMKQKIQDGVPELLAAGADPNAHSGINRARPLALAVRGGDTHLVELLLAAGADPNHQTADYRNLGVVAARQGDVEIFRLLQEAGLSLDHGKRTHLHRLAMEGDLEGLEKLLAAGADPDLLDEHGRSALVSMATQDAGREPEGEPERAAEAVRLLIRHGGDVNLRSNHDTTALGLAASRENKVGVCRVLVESGADVNATNGSDRRTALMNAARAGQAEIVELLLEAGADPNASSVGLNRSSPLVDALESDDARTVRLLLGAGARVSPPDRHWGDAFRRAAPHPELVRGLARLAEDVNAQDELHRLPVEQVVRYGIPESLEVMLAAGASVRCNRARSLLDPSRSGRDEPGVRAGMLAVLRRRCPGLPAE